MLAGLFGIMLASQSAATDFGIRAVGGAPVRASSALPATPGGAATTGAHRFFSLASVTRTASRFGRITSTVRSREHNRRVGGAANSWHLHGRAIDIVRRPGVGHAQLAAELRRQGYTLIESLDEGDHSHFAFSNGLTSRGHSRAPSEQLAEIRQEASYFRFVSAPSAPRPTTRLASVRSEP